MQVFPSRDDNGRHLVFYYIDEGIHIILINL